MKIALLGGTFNPIHNGHINLAEKIKSKFKYDKIFFIPSFIPVHKTNPINVLPIERLEMLEIALNDLDWASVSDCEIKRQGFSYSVETLRFFYKNYSFTGKPGLIIGDDLAAGFNSWRDPGKIIRLSDLIIAHRLYREEIPLSYKHKYIDNEIFSLSSSEIRDLHKRGESIESFLPERVHSYIIKKGLYL